MNKIPFSVYDLIAIFAPAFLLVVGLDYIVGDHWTDIDHIGVVPALKWTLLIYVLGQVVHAFALYIFEENISNRLIGNPKQILLTGQKPVGFKSFVNKAFGQCYSPLTDEQKEKILRRFADENVGSHYKDRYQHAFYKQRKDKDFIHGLQNHTVMTGFYRNLSFSCLALTLVAFTYGIFTQKPSAPLIGTIAFVMLIIMLSRYLKMSRLYIRVVFLTYLQSEK